MVAKKLLVPDDGSPPHEYKADVTITSDETFEDYVDIGHNHGYVLATLVSNLERTFTISPDSNSLDGKLRLVRFGGLDVSSIPILTSLDLCQRMDRQNR